MFVKKEPAGSEARETAEDLKDSGLTLTLISEGWLGWVQVGSKDGMLIKSTVYLQLKSVTFSWFLSLVLCNVQFCRTVLVVWLCYRGLLLP